MDTHSIMPRVIEIALLLIGSAYFSATETAFTSLNRIRVKNKADAGDPQAKRVLSMFSMMLLQSVYVYNIALGKAGMFEKKLIGSVDRKSVV